MKIHNLKIKKQFFDDVVSGKKKAEVRINDRDYQEGDILRMRVVDNEHLNDEITTVIITCVNDISFIADGYVLLSIAYENDLNKKDLGALNDK